MDSGVKATGRGAGDQGAADASVVLVRELEDDEDGDDATGELRSHRCGDGGAESREWARLRERVTLL